MPNAEIDIRVATLVLEESAIVFRFSAIAVLGLPFRVEGFVLEVAGSLQFSISSTGALMISVWFPGYGNLTNVQTSLLPQSQRLPNQGRRCNDGNGYCCYKVRSLVCAACGVCLVL